MGRHALLDAPDVPTATEHETVVPVTPSAEVRTVAEIIAQFRREQGLTPMPPRPDARADAPVPPATDAIPATDAVPARDDRADRDDSDRPLPPAGPPAGGPVEPAVRSRRDAAWDAALRPAGDVPQPRRRRAATGSSASAVIASLTAELAATHPGLLDGTPHRRRATPAPGRAAAKHTTPAGEAATLRPVRVTAGLRGAALRVPALASGWRVPTKTPLVLAGAVAVSVVVTDQAGLLSTSTTPQATADTTTRQQLAATVQANAAAATAADDAAAAGAAQARARVSRLQRSALPTAASQGATTAAGSTTAVGAAPPPDSVMKPGQTVPGDWVRPTAKGIYNSCFCSRWGTFHEGIDFAAPLGSPILAVGDGVVVQAGPASGFGNWVIIKHANGDMTIYGHMRYFFVKVGQQVKAGQEIALVGEEGQATGPHLHLGVKIGSTNGSDGTYVDPVPWLTARGIDVGVYNQNG